MRYIYQKSPGRGNDKCITPLKIYIDKICSAGSTTYIMPEEMHSALRGIPEGLRTAIIFTKILQAGGPLTIGFLGDRYVQDVVKKMARTGPTMPAWMS